MKKRLVIFDLDGTLADSLPALEYCGNHALEKFGFPSFGRECYKYFVGDGAATLVERALKKAGDKDLEHFEEVFCEFLVMFKEYNMYQVEPYEGITELIQGLKKKGILLAVLSNKEHSQTIQVIETLFGKGTFDWIQGRMDGVEKKPSPEGVYQIEEGLKVMPEEVVYIGDTNTDMITGKSAGVYTVGVLWGFRDRAELEEYQADKIIEEPMELLSLFE
ncbi:MAG: HAD family hydrolase [Eubacteriales bacterium]